VASVVADRVLGLLTMLALASTGILATGLFSAAALPVRVLCRGILIAAAISWASVAMLLLMPALSGSRIRAWAESIPFVGTIAGRLLGAVNAFRNQRRALAVAFSISVVMALCYVTSYYFIARGLVGAIPLTPSGLGTTELAVEELYKTMPGGESNRQGDGTMVALTRRATEIVVALLGLVFYLTHMRTVREVYNEATKRRNWRTIRFETLQSRKLRTRLEV
jgi:hypothetical protein